MLATEIQAAHVERTVKIIQIKPGEEELLIEAAKLLNDSIVSIQRAKELLSEPSFLLVIAQDDDGSIMGRIYGHVLHRFEQTDLFLYEVDVLEEYQRRGIGKAMLEFVSSFAQERGYKEWWVLTEEDNMGARALYESAGAILEAFPTAMYVFYAGQ